MFVQHVYVFIAIPPQPARLHIQGDRSQGSLNELPEDKNGWYSLLVSCGLILLQDIFLIIDFFSLVCCQGWVVFHSFLLKENKVTLET